MLENRLQRLQDYFARVNTDVFTDPHVDYETRFEKDLNERILRELDTIPEDSLHAGPDIVVTNDDGVSITVKVLYSEGQGRDEDDDYSDNSLPSHHYFLVAFAGDHQPDATVSANLLIGFKASHVFAQENEGTVHGYLAIRDPGKGYMSLLETANEIYKGMLAHDEALHLTSVVSNDNMVNLEQYQASLDPIEVTFRDLQNELSELEQRVGSYARGSMTWRSLQERIQYITEVLSLREEAQTFIQKVLRSKVEEQRRWNNAYSSFGYTQLAKYAWRKPVTEPVLPEGVQLDRHRNQMARIVARKSRDDMGHMVHTVIDYQLLSEEPLRQSHWFRQSNLWQQTILPIIRETAQE